MPTPVLQQPTEAVVRVTRTTICGTDLHLLKGDLPTGMLDRILGHEGINAPWFQAASPPFRFLLFSTPALFRVFRVFRRLNPVFPCFPNPSRSSGSMPILG